MLIFFSSLWFILWCIYLMPTALKLFFIGADKLKKKDAMEFSKESKSFFSKLILATLGLIILEFFTFFFNYIITKNS